MTRQNAHPGADEEALAWSLLATLGLTFGVVTACGWSIRRHQRRSGPEAALFEELWQAAAPRRNGQQPPLSSSPAPGPPESRAPWEQPADWWRQQDFHQD